MKEVVGVRTGFRLPSWAVGAVVAGLLACGGVAWSMVSFRIVDVRPAPGTWTRERATEIVVRYVGLPGGVHVAVDGRPLPVRVVSTRKLVAVHVRGLRDGPHRIAVEIDPKLGFAPVLRAWTWTVDTVPPVVTLTAPPPDGLVKDSPFPVTGRTKPGAKLTVSVSPGPGFHRTTVVADASGRFSVPVPLAENKNALRIAAVDRAGNRAELTRTLTCDRTPPAITNASTVPDVFRHQRDVTVRARVREDGSGIASARMRVDGRAEALKLPPHGGEVVFTAHDLPEGRRTVRLEVVDRAGWSSSHEWSFLLDTTETFGERPVTLGAVGRDVLQLQQRLAKWGVLQPEEESGTYDAPTQRAVTQFQMRHRLNPDGVAGYATIGALSPRIMIDQTRRTLTLMDMGKRVKSYRVAVGMPAYPTPSGSFRVVALKKNPPWLPPKGSAWARNARPIPPGPNNPLGSRWMGLDAGGVGIHGTNEDWAIGTRASHGCVRMHTKDAEDLFNRINEGTQVKIFWEKTKQVDHAG